VVLLVLVSGCRTVCDCGDADGSGEDAAREDGTPDGEDVPDVPDVPADTGAELPPGGREARGVWVTRWNYSSPGDVAAIMSSIASGGFNQVYFQVRGTADAYYASSLEPWSAGLGGLGEDPGWDPLLEAVGEAHARGLEIHAWLNTFPLWSGTSPPPSSSPEHIYNAHPEWICADTSGTPMPLGDGYVFGSPGNPDLQDHVAAVAADIARHYAVDGIHLDYIRYPGIGYCFDAVSESRYADAVAAEPSLSREDWQRDQVAATVRKVNEAVKAERAGAVLSAAVWFICRNVWGWSSVSQGCVEFYQDPRAWAAAGTIDAVIPMIYFDIQEPYGTRLDFRAMLDDHVAGMSGVPVHAGIDGDETDFADIAAEIAYTRSSGAAGYVVFAYTSIVDHDAFDDFAGGPNTDEAWPP
jgi:uncharacterized lipoprotein YddW (UPF0748 family)